MAEHTAIEWADATFNPWVGCQAVSAACDHCYAEAWVKRFGGDFAVRRRTSAANWKQPLKWNREAANAGIRKRVFCASLADVFDNQVPEEWRLDLWNLIRETPYLDWMLLTKRPQNIAKMLPPSYGFSWLDWPLSNVWLGTTVENQEEAVRRIPHLLAVPATVHFVSCEPLLSGVRLHDISLPSGRVLDALRGEEWRWDAEGVRYELTRDRRKIRWVITGGESGPNARPSDPRWFQELRDQCRAAGVAFHFKQWGEWHPGSEENEFNGYMLPCKPSANHEFSDGRWSFRVGKKLAGRVLDGVTHDARPV